MSVALRSRRLALGASAAHVSILEIQNGPLNFLNQTIRTSLLANISRAEADDDVKGIIVIGHGVHFSSGADLKELQGFVLSRTPPPRHAVMLPEVAAKLEDQTKPVVAAVHGYTMGGGLELALGCHAIVAAVDAKFSFPEVHLGLLPGAGGTQRLPRVVGVKHALSLLTSGRTIEAEEAQRMGLVSRICDRRELLDVALDTVSHLLQDSKPVKRASEVTCQESVNSAVSLVNYTKRILNPMLEERSAQASGTLAAVSICSCVLKAVTSPFEEGMIFEQQAFQRLLVSDEALGKQHIFFSERTATKPPDVPAEDEAALGQRAEQCLRHVGIVGAGTMGSGIAIAFLQAGARVTLMDVHSDSLANGLTRIRGVFERNVTRGKLMAEGRDRALDRLTTTTRMVDLSSCGLVVEAAFENMGVKQDVFRSLSQVCGTDTVFCSNTSTLDIDTLATAARNPSNFIGMHFFSPANVMKLIEIVVGKTTSSDTVAIITRISKALKKVGVVVGNCDGFVGNRLLQSYALEAGLILEEGFVPPEIDGELKKFGMAMGPFVMSDLAGNDISWRIRKAKNSYNPEKNFADVLCDRGRFGQKAMRGWYKYDKDKGKGRLPIPDEELHEELRAFLKRLPKVNRNIAQGSTDEIPERCFLPLVNEGFRVLNEGVAQRASDIDVIYIYGYGFPAWRGGPMFWAISHLGLGYVVEKMAQYRERFEPNADAKLRYNYAYRWQPCDLLLESARAFAAPTPSHIFEKFLRDRRRGSKL